MVYNKHHAFGGFWTILKAYSRKIPRNSQEVPAVLGKGKADDWQKNTQLTENNEKQKKQ